MNSRILKALAAAVLASTVAAACTSSETKQGPRPPRVVILGLDGGCWPLLDRFIERGSLPNLARLRKDGAWGDLESIVPSSSPVIWTTVATGKSPEKHGITWFVRFPEPGGKPAPVNRTQRKAEPFWNILGRRGFDVAVVGWFVTWPAEAVNGRLISDVAHWGDVEHKSFPPYYLDSLAPVSEQETMKALPEFMDLDYDPAKVNRNSSDPEERLQYLVYDRFVRAYSRDLFYLRAAQAVLHDGPLPEVLALYLRGTDDVQHGFWKFMEPEAFENPPPPEQVAAFGKVIERYWHWIDEGVGELLDRYDEPPFVIVVSDHGAGPADAEHPVNVPQYMHLSGTHRDKGIMVLHGPGVRRGYHIENASVYDVTPTLLHYLGQPVGKDMDGKVLLDPFEPAIAEAPIETVDTYEPDKAAAAESAVQDPAVQDRMLEHLRSLGYIDPEGSEPAP